MATVPPKPPDDDLTSVRRIDVSLLDPSSAPTPVNVPQAADPAADPAATMVFRPPGDRPHDTDSTSIRPMPVLPPDPKAPDAKQGAVARRMVDDPEAATQRALQPVKGGRPGPLPETVTPSILRRVEDVADVARTALGTVKRSWDPLLERPIARKVAEAKADPEAIARLAFEAKVMARLDHPAVLPVHDFVEEAGNAWFSMKFAEGRTLEEVASAPGFDVTDEKAGYDVLQKFVRVCEAVAFAHSRGVLHCDLKPSSVLLGTHGQVYVTDWGAAQRLGEPVRTIRGRLQGTPAYMAPEQAQGRLDAIDRRTDVYGLGAILYRLLTNRAPNAAAPPPHPSEVVRDRPLPKRLCDVAMRALSTDAAARHSNVESFQADVESFVRGDGRHETKAYLPGALVVKEGDTGDAAYVISKGRARAFKTVDGERISLREMGPGEVFGETAIFSASPRSASVEALEALTVTVIRRSSLDDEMGRTFWMGYLVQALAGRFKDVDAKATALGLERDRDALALEIWSWFATRAKPGEPLPRAVPWTPLRVALCRKFKRNPPDTVALTQKVQAFELDLVRDELRVR